MEGVIYYLAVIEMAPIVDRHSELAAMSPKIQPHTCTWQLRKGRQWCDPGIPSDIQTPMHEGKQHFLPQKMKAFFQRSLLTPSHLTPTSEAGYVASKCAPPLNSSETT